MSGWPRYNSSQTVQPKRKLNTENDEKQKNRQHRCRHTTCSRQRESGRAKRARLVQWVVMATQRRAEQVARSSMWAALLRERAAFSQKATALLR